MSPKKWRRYDSSYDARAEARAAALLQEKEEAKPQFSQANLNIAVVGAQPRIGTTSFAIHLADYFTKRGATAAVMNMNPRGDMQLEMMCDIYNGIDNGNGNYQINDIDFYASSALGNIDGVEIHDYGNIADEPDSFSGYDKLFLIGGTSWSELPMMYQAQKELNASNYTAIINFSSAEQIKRNNDILSLNLNEVIRAPFEPNTFSSVAYEDIFDEVFDSFRDSEQSEDDVIEEY